MEYVYASLILHHAKKEVTEEGIRKILEAAGINVEETRVKALVAALKEVNIDDIIKSSTLMPVAPVSAPSTEIKKEEKKEEKKEKKKEEKKTEEEIAEGLAALFG